MTVLYNHRAVEQKWRENWKKHPVNVNDGKKPKYYCLDMFPQCNFCDSAENSPEAFSPYFL